MSEIAKELAKEFAEGFREGSRLFFAPFKGAVNGAAKAVHDEINRSSSVEQKTSNEVIHKKAS